MTVYTFTGEPGEGGGGGGIVKRGEIYFYSKLCFKMFCFKISKLMVVDMHISDTMNVRRDT